MKEIPHSKPWVTDEDVRAVAAVLRGDFIAQGEITERFERALAGWVGASGAVGVGSGSAAIVLSLTAIGAGAGHEVVLPTYVCASVLEAVLAVGAKPVLADVGENWVMTADDAAAAVNQNTRAIIIPHIYGIFADVAGFRRFGIPIIEDCAQALGAQGRCSIEGDIAIYSFHPTKCLTTGEGGMAASRDVSMVDRMRTLRDGDRKNYAPRLFSPLSDVASALGLSQMSRYDDMLVRRKAIAAEYRRAIGQIIPESLPDARIDTMHFRFPLKIKGGATAFQSVFMQHGVHVRKGVDCLLHRMSGADDSSYPRAVEHYNTTLSLPIYPALTDEELARCLTSAAAVFASQH